MLYNEMARIYQELCTNLFRKIDTSLPLVVFYTRTVPVENWEVASKITIGGQSVNLIGFLQQCSKFSLAKFGAQRFKLGTHLSMIAPLTGFHGVVELDVKKSIVIFDYH